MEGRLCLHSGFWSSWICPRLGFELCRCAAVKLTARMVVWATFSLPPHLLGINHFYELLVSSVLSWENWMGMMRHFHAVDELKLIRHQIFFFLKLKLSSLLCNHFSNCFLIVVNFKCVNPNYTSMQLQWANTDFCKQQNLFAKKKKSLWDHAYNMWQSVQ